MIPTWPPLYKTNKPDAKGKSSEQVWMVRVEDHGDHAVIISTHGKVGGKMTEAPYPVREGKNAGKRNATTPLTQAIFVAESDFAKKKTKGYSEERGGVDMTIEGGCLMPMLAKDYEGIEAFDGWGQPKFNGGRTVVTKKNGEIIVGTRGMKTWGADLSHIMDVAKEVLEEGENFDGELYCHGATLGQIMSWAQSTKPETKKLHLRVYDSVLNAKFSDRFDFVRSKLGTKGVGGVLLPSETIKLNGHADVKQYYLDCIAAGYEGEIIRLDGSAYEPGRRSNALLRLKEMKEAEYQIVGVNEGTGVWEGVAATVTCRTAEGATFNPTLKRTFEEKKAIWDAGRGAALIGKWVKVQYFDLTRSSDREELVPQFCVALELAENPAARQH